MSVRRRTEPADRETLRAVDRAFADALRRQDRARGADTDERVLQAATLASFAVGEGHAAFDPARPQLLIDDGRPWPEASEWRAALAASRWIDAPAADAASDPAKPLTFEGGLLYLRRYREYERRLAAGLLRLAQSDAAPADVRPLASLFAALFPQARQGDLQARAAALALLRKLLFVTGGPGTGKTTTIARLLALLAAQARETGHAAPRIALAAPTGRAAERMAQSLASAIAQMRAAGIDPALCDALPAEARTLHRLLGPVGDTPRFRHDRDNPLPFDAVVVDEASMVDLPLMCKLVEAVPSGARLILLGDRDQLPSVEAGDVLAAIVDAAGEDETLAPEDAAALAPLLGAPPKRGASVANDSEAAARQMSLFVRATPAPSASPLAGHRVQLRRGYRQSQSLELAPLAEAARLGDADRVLSLLGGGLRGVAYHAGATDPLAASTREALLTPWRELTVLDDPAAALERAARQRVLCALRDGAQGASRLNARIEEALAGAQRETYFHGRLLLVAENSYRHGLFNGDIGVCLRGSDGAAVAWFGGAAGVRGFHPATLPAHTGAFAVTVHKAQGSEFDTVWLQMPAVDTRVASRELLYTAITRARNALHLCADETVLRAALARHAMRVSGLAGRLKARVASEH
ncbi:exodeoxyribonuclease V subunit alpha [Luteimonas gilva]|uniref:RecBCD enzyme subunit RecD n=1 Tax=Luteimonas gilva TaxID=2572684 RepID=A0A4U5JLY7_9GAMM|nr:exodeoxyribonuclease V subunit alpha [Luteimonas gilva]TKR30185.1 exodeoxyribonuclease V subunit alpha [Luteimonas gilva]